MELFGIRLVGLTAENGQKFLLTLGLVAAVLALRFLLNLILRAAMRGRGIRPARSWGHQGVSLVTAGLLILGFLSIWFDEPERLATAMGLVGAGLAFALQKVVTSVAGYFVILRGGVFSVGDRILMAGVRGDVIALNFTRTTIMEMGQPPGERPDDPNVWVKSRQYTGRVVTVTNDKIFEDAVYNYSRDFPYLWEELTVPVTFTCDRRRAEEILLAAARRHTVEVGEMSKEALEEMRRRYYHVEAELRPRVYYRITDNWLELSLRFVVPEHGARNVKDKMSREILEEFDGAGIGIASATFEVVGLPPLVLRDEREQGGKADG